MYCVWLTLPNFPFCDSRRSDTVKFCNKNNVYVVDYSEFDSFGTFESKISWEFYNRQRTIVMIVSGPQHKYEIWSLMQSSPMRPVVKTRFSDQVAVLDNVTRLLVVCQMTCQEFFPHDSTHRNFIQLHQKQNSVDILKQNDRNSSCCKTHFHVEAAFAMASNKKKSSHK